MRKFASISQSNWILVYKYWAHILRGRKNKTIEKWFARNSQSPTSAEQNLSLHPISDDNDGNHWLHFGDCIALARTHRSGIYGICLGFDNHHKMGKYIAGVQCNLIIIIIKHAMLPTTNVATAAYLHSHTISYGTQFGWRIDSVCSYELRRLFRNSHCH